MSYITLKVKYIYILYKTCKSYINVFTRINLRIRRKASFPNIFFAQPALVTFQHKAHKHILKLVPESMSLDIFYLKNLLRFLFVRTMFKYKRGFNEIFEDI